MKARTQWSENPLIINEGHGNSISLLLKKITNEPLPWFGLLSLIVIVCTAYSVHSVGVAEQARQDAWRAETQSLMLREHVDQLRFELASHGIIPPPYPKEIKK